MKNLALVHLCRHGKVFNPDRILYSRLPGFHLSEEGQAMADGLAKFFADTPLNYLGSSPMERAQETMAPIAKLHPGLEVVTDTRLTEAASRLQGQAKGLWSLRLIKPANWRYFIDFRRPGWGEGFAAMGSRVTEAIADAGRMVGPGGQAVLISHQGPIWAARRMAEAKFLFNVPATRRCRLASVTTFTVTESGRVGFQSYLEPVRI